MRTPVGLIILKGDLLMKMMNKGNSSIPPMELIWGKLERLFALCNQRCRHFHWFLVSAVGVEEAERKEDAPPTELNPQNVIEPMIWALRHFRREG